MKLSRKPAQTRRTPRHFTADLELYGKRYEVLLRPANPALSADLMAIVSRVSGGDGDEAVDTALWLRACGAAVGLCWCDAMWQLETERPRRFTEDDLTAYGDGILDELTDAGLDMAEQVDLGRACMDACGRSLSVPSEEEVAGRAGFSEADGAARY